MGNYLSRYITPMKSHMLCDEIINDDDDFIIHIKIHFNERKNIEFMYTTIKFLQYTNPSFSYADRSNIYLLYNHKKKQPFLRSNIASYIISYLSSELSIWMFKNNMADIRMIGINIKVDNLEIIQNDINTMISLQKNPNKYIIYDCNN
jgi:hypothetical protein